MRFRWSENGTFTVLTTDWLEIRSQEVDTPKSGSDRLLWQENTHRVLNDNNDHYDPTMMKPVKMLLAVGSYCLSLSCPLFFFHPHPTPTPHPSITSFSRMFSDLLYSILMHSFAKSMVKILICAEFRLMIFFPATLSVSSVDREVKLRSRMAWSMSSACQTLALRL